jgi:hypothetical protein
MGSLSGSFTLYDVEFNAPIFVKVRNAARFDGRDMDEHVRSPPSTLRKPMPLRGLNHFTVPCVMDFSLP